MDETLINFGSEIKVLGETEDAWRIGGYGVVFGTRDVTSLKDEFDASTDFDFTEGATRTLYYNHGLDGTIKKAKMGQVSLHLKDDGVWYEGELKKRNDYLARHAERIVEGIKNGVFGTSTGAPAHLVERVKDGEGHSVKMWPIAEVSITPTPAEPLTTCISLKSLLEIEAADDEIKKYNPNQPRGKDGRWNDGGGGGGDVAGHGSDGSGGGAKLHEMTSADFEKHARLWTDGADGRTASEIIAANGPDKKEENARVKKQADDLRYQTIQNALFDGKHVPDHVLNDYPSLRGSKERGMFGKKSIDDEADTDPETKSLEILEQGQIYGSRFVDHSERVLAANSEFKERFDRLASIAASTKAGRVLSEANLSRLKDHHAALCELTASMGQMLDEHMPVSKTDDAVAGKSLLDADDLDLEITLMRQRMNVARLVGNFN